jgi:hypothetical protein
VDYQYSKFSVNITTGHTSQPKFELATICIFKIYVSSFDLKLHDMIDIYCDYITNCFLKIFTLFKKIFLNLVVLDLITPTP